MATQRLAAQSCRGPRSRTEGASRSARTTSLSRPDTASAELVRKQNCGNGSTPTLQWEARVQDNRRREHSTSCRVTTIIGEGVFHAYALGRSSDCCFDLHFAAAPLHRL